MIGDWINLAHNNVYQLAGIESEYILVDDIQLAIKILKSLDNTFYQCQVIPQDEVDDFFEGEQIILHSWNEYLLIQGKRIEDKNVNFKYEKAKAQREMLKKDRRVGYNDF